MSQHAALAFPQTFFFTNATGEFVICYSNFHSKNDLQNAKFLLEHTFLYIPYINEGKSDPAVIFALFCKFQMFLKVELLIIVCSITTHFKDLNV